MWLIKKKKNINYKYIIKLENDEKDSREMHFILNNTEPAKKFIQMVLNLKKRSINKITYTHSFDSDLNSPVNLCEILNSHINLFNALQKKTSNFQFDLFEFSGYQDKDQQFLNKLHANFEKWFANNDLYENLEFNNQENIEKAQYHLNRINSSIHMVEAKLPTKYSIDSDNPYLHGRISFTTKQRFKLRKKWHKYFSMAYSFGDLRMNYATRGKNLGHIFKDNDLEHLKEGGRPIPQSSFNTGINAFFGGFCKNKLSQRNCLHEHDETIQKIKKWIRDNNLKNKYKIDYEVSSCPGYILLGKFVPSGLLSNDSTILQVFDYYAEYKNFVDYSIEEIDIL